jgi:hypothetical protein
MIIGTLSYSRSSLEVNHPGFECMRHLGVVYRIQIDLGAIGSIVIQDGDLLPAIPLDIRESEDLKVSRGAFISPMIIQSTIRGLK